MVGAQERTMRTTGIAIATWGVLWVALAGCSGGKASGPSLDEQVKKAMAITSGESRATKLIAVAAKQQAAGDSYGASSSLAAAAEAAKSVEKPAARVRSLCQVVTALQGTGESKSLLKAASNAADQATDSKDKAAAVTRLAVAYGLQIKDLDVARLHLKNAEEEANKIEAPEDKVIALLGIADAEMQLSNAEHAGALAQQALELAGTITRGRAKSETLASAGLALNKMKKTEESKKAFDDATAEAAKIGDAMDQSYAYLEVAKKLTTAGQKPAAAQLLEKAAAKAQKVDISIRGPLIEAIDAAKVKAS